MKINKTLTALFTVFLISAAFFLNSCKDENNVEPPPIINQNPNTPQLIEPANNGIINSFGPLLKWQPFENASGYLVQMSLDANFLSHLYLDTVVTNTELSSSNLLPGTNIYYYWRVMANLQAGGSTGWSAIWRFQVILTPPPAPLLLLPPNNAIDQSYLPLFDWSDASTAQYYRLQVSEIPGFSSILLDIPQIINSQIQCPPFFLSTNTLYYWRVNASNSNGLSVGDWSQVFSFRTIDGITPYSISGTIRFADTNFVQPPARYIIGAFPFSVWPPSGQIPNSVDTLDIKWENNEYVAHYRIRNLSDDIYCIGVYSQFIFKGIYGCDTNRSIFSTCPLVSPGTVNISGGIGVENINFLSWADSSKNIF